METDETGDLRRKINNVFAPFDESQNAYKEWVPTYEQDLLSKGYSAPVITSRYVCNVVPRDLRASTRVLDVGAGTGLVAKELRDAGFVNIDALDPNEDMLQVAKERKLYDNYFVEYIQEAPSSLTENSYDIIAASGIYGGEGHVPCEAIIEIIRLVKPGGYIVIVTRKHWITHDPYTGLEQLMRQFESEGKWKQIVRDIVPKYYFQEDGITWTYKKL